MVGPEDEGKYSCVLGSVLNTPATILHYRVKGQCREIWVFGRTASGRGFGTGTWPPVRTGRWAWLWLLGVATCWGRACGCGLWPRLGFGQPVGAGCVGVALDRGVSCGRGSTWQGWCCGRGLWIGVWPPSTVGRVGVVFGQGVWAWPFGRGVAVLRGRGRGRGVGPRMLPPMGRLVWAWSLVWGCGHLPGAGPPALADWREDQLFTPGGLILSWRVPEPFGRCRRDPPRQPSLNGFLPPISVAPKPRR